MNKYIAKCAFMENRDCGVWCIAHERGMDRVDLKENKKYLSMRCLRADGFIVKSVVAYKAEWET